jgi:hypothetical protein
MKLFAGWKKSKTTLSWRLPSDEVGLSLSWLSVRGLIVAGYPEFLECLYKKSLVHNYVQQRCLCSRVSSSDWDL